MSTPIERAARAAWPHYFTGDPNFDFARNEVLATRARAAIDAAADPGELARVIDAHGSLAAIPDEGTECECGETVTDSIETYAEPEWRKHQAAAIRDQLLTEETP